MSKETIYNIIIQGEGMQVDQFIDHLENEFDLPIHKWTVFDEQESPFYRVTGKTIYNDDGYEVLALDLDNYNNISCIKNIDYDLFN